jgi:hypothetical protein
MLMSQIYVTDLHNGTPEALSLDEQSQIGGGIGTPFNDIPRFEIEEVVTLPDGTKFFRLKLLPPRPDPNPPKPPVPFGF